MHAADRCVYKRHRPLRHPDRTGTPLHCTAVHTHGAAGPAHTQGLVRACDAAPRQRGRGPRVVRQHTKFVAPHVAQRDCSTRRIVDMHASCARPNHLTPFHLRRGIARAFFRVSWTHFRPAVGRPAENHTRRTCLMPVCHERLARWPSVSADVDVAHSHGRPAGTGEADRTLTHGAPLHLNCSPRPFRAQRAAVPRHTAAVQADARAIHCQRMCTPNRFVGAGDRIRRLAAERAIMELGARFLMRARGGDVVDVGSPVDVVEARGVREERRAGLGDHAAAACGDDALPERRAGPPAARDEGNRGGYEAAVSKVDGRAVHSVQSASVEHALPERSGEIRAGTDDNASPCRCARVTGQFLAISQVRGWPRL